MPIIPLFLDGPDSPATDAPIILHVHVEPFVVVGNAEPEIPPARIEPTTVTVEV